MLYVLKLNIYLLLNSPVFGGAYHRTNLIIAQLKNHKNKKLFVFLHSSC